MRFGFTVYPYDAFPRPEDFARVFRHADDLGFGYATFPEHVLLTPQDNEELANRSWWDFTTLAAWLAAQTRQIEFFPGIYLLPLTNFGRIARQLATLDQVSGGRVVFGIGVGWNAPEFERLGVSFADRARIGNEYCAALKALWSQEPSTFRGRHVSFENVSCVPKPVRGTIPILVGGNAAPGPMARLVQSCDGWVPWKITQAELPGALQALHARMRAAGRDPAGMRIVWTLTLGENPAITQASRHASEGGNAADEARRSPIEEIRALEAIGVNMLTLNFGWSTLDELMREMDRFAREVMPHFPR
ncbi:MAG: TIGR03619 family F420-dependent LLM class oxidoreductase [Gammaproteobacteria bacterium]